MMSRPTYCLVMSDILTAKPIPTEQPATNKANALFAGTPTATTTSSPGTSPTASKPLAIPSAYKKTLRYELNTDNAHDYK